MFDIGFTELLVIGVVALIVVGPKDLPQMFRTLGRFTARARQMAREFSSAMNEAADQAGAKDVADTLKSATNPKSMGLDALNKAAEGFEKWDPAKALKDQKDADAATKTPELSEERAEVARKIHEATAKAATDQKAKEAAEAAEKPVDPAMKSTAKKPASKKPAAKKAPATKAAPKTTTPKTTTAKKAATKKAAPKKTAKKTASKTATKTSDASDA